MTRDAAVVAKLCNLPLDFRAGGRSPLQLVVESGYFEEPKRLTITGVAQFLAANPQLVDAWLRWSEDKRVSRGWYFTKVPEGYKVAYYPKGQHLAFSSKTLACAEFIVREVVSIHDASR